MICRVDFRARLNRAIFLRFRDSSVAPLSRTYVRKLDSSLEMFHSSETSVVAERNEHVFIDFKPYRRIFFESLSLLSNITQTRRCWPSENHILLIQLWTASKIQNPKKKTLRDSFVRKWPVPPRKTAPLNYPKMEYSLILPYDVRLDIRLCFLCSHRFHFGADFRWHLIPFAAIRHPLGCGVVKRYYFKGFQTFFVEHDPLSPSIHLENQTSFQYLTNISHSLSKDVQNM